MSLNLKNIFTQRLGLKLASILLSLVVFTHVYTEQEREWILDVPLEITGLSEDLCYVSSPPAKVVAQVRGKGKNLIKLKFKEARAMVDLSNVGQGTVRRVLSGSDVVIPPDLNVTVADVLEPNVLSLELDSRVEKSVRVVPVYSGALASGLSLSGPPEVEPEQIKVSGARKVIAQLDYINTEPIDIGGMTDKSTVEAELDPGALNLALEPSSVRVTFVLEKAEQRRRGDEDLGGSSLDGG